jgi:hypothetical protein
MFARDHVFVLMHPSMSSILNEVKLRRSLVMYSTRRKFCIQSTLPGIELELYTDLRRETASCRFPSNEALNHKYIMSASGYPTCASQS